MPTVRGWGGGGIFWQGSNQEPKTIIIILNKSYDFFHLKVEGSIKH